MVGTASDSELLQASLAGSRDAFGVIVQRYQALVCALTYSATGSVAKSEDLAQEAFIKAWQGLRQLKNLGEFRAWLCAIARNLGRRSLRDRSKNVIEAAAPLEVAEALAAAAPGPGETAIDREQQEAVWVAVRKVPPEYREPLVLFYRQQRSVRQVAADLDLSEEAVRQRLHRGRQLVKAEVSSLVEDVLSRSRPGKTFAIAVLASLPALVTPPASAAVVGLAAKGVLPAKTAAAAGLSGAILGPILGLYGGLLGAWISLKTNSPRERRLMGWLFIIWLLLFFPLIALPLTLFLAGLVPQWTLAPCVAMFLIVNVVLLVSGKIRQRRIQAEESACRGPGHPPTPRTRQSIYGSVGGGVIGSTGPVLYQLAVAGHWVSVGAIVAFDILVFLAVTRICLRNFEL